MLCRKKIHFPLMRLKVPCSGLTFFGFGFSLVREALEKDNISFNSSMGAAKHHWPIAMVLLVEAQDHRKKTANELQGKAFENYQLRN